MFAGFRFLGHMKLKDDSTCRLDQWKFVLTMLLCVINELVSLVYLLQNIEDLIVLVFCQKHRSLRSLSKPLMQLSKERCFQY